MAQAAPAQIGMAGDCTSDRQGAIDGLPCMEQVQRNPDGSIARVLVPLIWNLKTCCGGDSTPFSSDNMKVPSELAARGLSSERWIQFAEALRAANVQRPYAVESSCAFFNMVLCMPTLGMTMCIYNKVRESCCAASWSQRVLNAVADLNADMEKLGLGLVAKTQSVMDSDLRVQQQLDGPAFYADLTFIRHVAFAFTPANAELLRKEDHCFFVPPSGAIVSGSQFEKNARLGCLPNIPPSGNQFCLHPWG